MGSKRERFGDYFSGRGHGSAPTLMTALLPFVVMSFWLSRWKIIALICNLTASPLFVNLLASEVLTSIA